MGSGRLPELARTLGRGMAEFRRASSDLRQSFDLSADDPPRTASRAPDPSIDPREQRDPNGRPDQVAGAPASDSPPDTIGNADTDRGSRESTAAAHSTTYQEAKDEAEVKDPKPSPETIGD